MIYRLSNIESGKLQNLPEIGMGFQIIEATPEGQYSKYKYTVFNSEFVIENDGNEHFAYNHLFSKAHDLHKIQFKTIKFSHIKLYDEIESKTVVNEHIPVFHNAAILNPIETARGGESFVRLSAFKNDKRVDTKVLKCLKPGSYATSIEDYNYCIENNLNPIDRYALPNLHSIKWTFFIVLKPRDTFQRVTVQQAFGKIGGGEEAYFDKGTKPGTITHIKPYITK